MTMTMTMTKNLRGLYGFAAAAACAAVLGSVGVPTEARANLILLGGTATSSFTDLGAQGFGNAPRLLTLQNNDTEGGQLVLSSGGVASTASFGGRNDVSSPCCDGSKNSAPSLAQLGWSSGADVKIGLNTGENNTGITLSALSLFLYDNTNTLVNTFSLAGAINFTAAELALQQGNGNGIFEFVLDNGQQNQFTNALNVNAANFHIALGATFTNTEDGPDSFLGVRGPGATFIPPSSLVPEPGTLALLGLALSGLAGLRRGNR